jgi:hypothetical protein
MPNPSDRLRTRWNCVVDLQAREEHQQQLADLGEELRDLAVFWRDAQPARAERDARGEQADDTG